MDLDTIFSPIIESDRSYYTRTLIIAELYSIKYPTTTSVSGLKCNLVEIVLRLPFAVRPVFASSKTSLPKRGYAFSCTRNLGRTDDCLADRQWERR
jgi:hypothetical protein